ncbi:hypothetical protein DL96DRAFT_712476 [Flagelloscypha sp. PMI_526]|nr:hypothetical protein DL96DRAFT_712476 [Flagelloscypha sp. PMI_526]
MSRAVIFSLLFLIFVLAAPPHQETAEAKIPTSDQIGTKFQWTDGTGAWMDLNGQDSVTFTDGVAGYRIADEPETEVIYTYHRNVDFQGDLGPSGADLEVYVDFTVLTEYDSNSNSSATTNDTIYYGDLGCGVDMSYSVVFVSSSGDISEPIKGGGELTVIVPPGTVNATVDETNRIAGDQEVVVYNGQYLDVQVKSRGPKISATQAVKYHYCPEGSGW